MLRSPRAGFKLSHIRGNAKAKAASPPRRLLPKRQPTPTAHPSASPLHLSIVMGIDRATQRDVVMEIAIREWFETEEAADVARCERLSAAIQSIQDTGVRVLSENRYFGSRKLIVYLVPPPTELEMQPI